MKEKNDNDLIKSALIKRATGFTTEETTSEYQIDENFGEMLVKKKVTTKDVPPDMTAIKMLLGEDDDIENMTDEELIEEKNKLIELIKNDKNL